MADIPESVSLSRRSFGKGALLATAAAVTVAFDSSVEAQNVDNSFPHSPGLSPDVVDRMKARYDNIIREYGSRLSTKQRKHVRQILAENERMLAPVMAFPLNNGAAPADVLKFPEAAEQGDTDAR